MAVERPPTFQSSPSTARPWRSACGPSTSGSRGHPDDVFRLPARLADGELTYQAPNGAWVELARFEDGHFVDLGSGRKRIYEPISAGDLDPPDRALVPQQGPG